MPNFQSIKERRSLRAPLGAPLVKVRARARPPLRKKIDERERERRSKNRRALQLSAARSFETGRNWIFH
jgi:hypothetical protein